MNSYKQWAAANLCVGGYPNPTDLDEGEALCDYDVFINVSDEHRPDHYARLITLGKDTHWFPMGEMRGTMPLASIFGALTMLYDAEKRDRSVYLHCHSGVNRSQTVADCYYFLREEGTSHREKHTVRAKVRGLNLNALQTNCHYGVLPPLLEMEVWLLRVAEQLDTPDGGSFDYSKPPVFIHE